MLFFGSYGLDCLIDDYCSYSNKLRFLRTHLAMMNNKDENNINILVIDDTDHLLLLSCLNLMTSQMVYYNSIS